MIYIRSFMAFILLFCLSLEPSFASEEKNNASRSFWHPSYLGERLDYCTVDGTKCGKEVADQYCKLSGYDFSRQNVIAHNVGLTRFILSRLQCTGWRCNGFMTITCVTNLSHIPSKPYHYRKKRFVYPRFNNYRLDWCFVPGHGCGARAANSFCSHLGFIQARSFCKESSVGATKSIGNQELCFGHQCNAFKEIVCYR